MTTTATAAAYVKAAQVRGLSLIEAAQQVRDADPALATELERLAGEGRASRADKHGREQAVVTPPERG